MKILFIGGTGVISAACAKAAIERGNRLWCLTRGESRRPVPENAKHLKADIYQPESVRKMLEGLAFDAVVD